MVRSELADADDASSSDSSVVISHSTHLGVAAKKSRGSPVPSRDEFVPRDRQAGKEANSASHPKAKITGTVATSQTEHRSFRDAPPLSPSFDPSPSSTAKRATAADFFTLPSTPEPGEIAPRSRASTTEAIAALLEEEKSKKGRLQKRKKSPEARPPPHHQQEEKDVSPSASNGLPAPTTRPIDPRAEDERYSVPADRRGVKKVKHCISSSSEEAAKRGPSSAKEDADLPIPRRDRPEKLSNTTETRAHNHKNLAAERVAVPTSGGEEDEALLPQSPHHHPTDYLFYTRFQQHPNTKAAVAPMPPSTNTPERDPCTEPCRAVKKAPRRPRRLRCSRVLSLGSSYRPRYDL